MQSGLPPKKFDQVVITDLIRDEGGKEVPADEAIIDVSKLLAKDGEDPSKKVEIETEPHRNRTCNLLIKSQLLCQLS